MKLRAIHDQQLAYVRNSGVTVETVPIYGYVTISDQRGAEIFLQSDEGSEFIENSRHLWNFGCDGQRTEAECDEITAYTYCDLLAELDGNGS